MSECLRFKTLLALHVGGDLDPAGAEALEAHLAGCGACSRERDELAGVIAAARGLFQRPQRLDPQVRRRILAGAGAGSGFWRARTAWWVGQLSPRPGLSMAAVAAVFLAVVALPLALRPGPGGPPGVPEAVRIDLRLEGGAVRLAWSDGRKGPYTVSKSSDPQGLDQAEVHSVRGNVWVDENPGSSPIVFYRID